MNLRTKLIIIFLLIAVIPMLFMGMILFNYQKENLQDRVIKEREVQITEQVNQIQVFIDGFISQLKLVIQYPPVQGMIRTRQREIDPIDRKSTYKEWKNRLEEIFIIMAQADKQIQQLRYIDENGDEIVRINSRENILQIVSDDNLQNKKRQEYFIETMKLAKGEVYVSSITLNQEYGIFEKPYNPMLRIAMPIFSEVDGSKKGIIVINLSVNFIQSMLERASLGYGVLIDQEGDFIFHPEEQKRFSNSLHSEFNYFKDQPELSVNLKKGDYRNHHDVKDFL